MPVKIFFCYAHEDELFLNKLKTHLRPLQRQGLIDVWHDRDISAGTEWEHEINTHLNTAQIILLLVSPDFMDSDYCYGIEMKRAIERHDRGDARVIPVILRPTLWLTTTLGKLQALPKDAKPVINWQNLDDALFSIAEGINDIVMALRKAQEDQTKKVQEEQARKAEEARLRKFEEEARHRRTEEEGKASRAEQERIRQAGQTPPSSTFREPPMPANPSKLANLNQPDNSPMSPLWPKQQPRIQKPKIYFQPEETEILSPPPPSLKQQSKAIQTNQLSGSVLEPTPSIDTPNILSFEDVETSGADQEEAHTFAYLVSKANDYCGWVFLLLEVLLFLRFILMLIGGNSNNPFTIFLYGLTGALLAIFQGVIEDLRFGANGIHIFEWSTLVGMLVYGLLFTALMRFLHIVVSRPAEPPNA